MLLPANQETSLRWEETGLKTFDFGQGGRQRVCKQMCALLRVCMYVCVSLKCLESECVRLCERQEQMIMYELSVFVCLFSDCRVASAIFPLYILYVFDSHVGSVF